MAAKRNATGGSSNLRVFYAILAILAVGGGGWITYSVVTRGGGAALEPVELTGIDNPQALLAQAQGVSVGPATARVQVLVFSDFTCPACRSFTGVVEPQLKAEFVETGKVRFVYYDFPLGGPAHVHGFLAARAARCAQDQDKFWEYHDLLFARQAEWAQARRPPVGELVDYAELLSLDTRAFESCVQSDRHADVVTANRVLGERLGVPATPTVFIGSRSLTDWYDYGAVRAAIQRELGESPSTTS